MYIGTQNQQEKKYDHFVFVSINQSMFIKLSIVYCQKRIIGNVVFRKNITSFIPILVF